MLSAEDINALLTPAPSVSKSGRAATSWCMSSSTPMTTRSDNPISRRRRTSRPTTSLLDDEAETTYDPNDDRAKPLSSSPRGREAAEAAAAMRRSTRIANERALNTKDIRRMLPAPKVTMESSLKVEEEAAKSLSVTEKLKELEAEDGSASDNEGQARPATTGTSSFRSIGRDGRKLEMNAPPIGHYNPRYDVVQPRARTADFGKRSRHTSRMEVRNEVQIAYETQQLMAYVSSKGDSSEAAKRRAVSAGLESAPFRSKTRRQTVEPRSGVDVMYDAKFDLVGKRSVTPVDMARTLPRKEVVPVSSQDAFYEWNEDAVRPRTAMAVSMAKTTGRKEWLTPPRLDIVYDINESHVTKRPQSAPFFDQQISREARESLHHTADPKLDTFYDVRETVIKKRTPGVDISKLTKRKPPQIPNQLDKTYNPDDAMTRPSPPGPPQFDKMVKPKSQILPLVDVVYDAKDPLPHVPTVRFDSQVGRDHLHDRTALDVTYDVKLDLVEKKPVGAPSFGTVVGREKPPLRARQQPAIDVTYNVKDTLLRPRSPSFNMGKFVGRDDLITQKNGVDDFYDPNYAFVEPRMPVHEFPKAGARPGRK